MPAGARAGTGEEGFDGLTRIAGFTTGQTAPPWLHLARYIRASFQRNSHASDHPDRGVAFVCAAGIGATRIAYPILQKAGAPALVRAMYHRGATAIRCIASRQQTLLPRRKPVTPHGLSLSALFRMPTHRRQPKARTSPRPRASTHSKGTHHDPQEKDRGC